MVKQQQQQLGGLISSLFRSSNKEVLPCPSTSSSFAWQWPSCGQQPRTHSFRQVQQLHVHGHDETATMNSVYSSADYSSFPTEANSDSALVEEAADEAAVIVCARRSGRLFFEPDASSFILNNKKKPELTTMKKVEEDDDQQHQPSPDTVAFGGGTAMMVESRDPYRDFRESMEAMVMSHHAHGGRGANNKDRSWLEEMLGWYLRANGKSTHGLIVAAFVDLLVSLGVTDTDTSSPANCSSSSSDDDNDCDECSSPASL